ncbi:PCYCGC motif-containing (lipo)protein [Aquibacillus kalidii]|uniref:PCYCGC motif-containing (lipo)protein n=1 Tax=Aquibacillus kalidii TaxID=2762597 RepID=UPI001648FC15|nr:PCYCGC motif-containing (lipo)protein [Aquibacillus kalidii]
MRSFILSFTILTTALLGACSAADTNELEESARQTLSNGDIREETTSVEELPSFLVGKNEDMQQLYTVAAQHEELLEHIPCYCGCGQSANHKDNYDCFVHQYNEDGSLVWDDHGTKCQVCLDIAAESINMSREGKTIKEIRIYIDEKYKDGYAEPTPTPNV